MRQYTQINKLPKAASTYLIWFRLVLTIFNEGSLFDI